MTPQIIHVDYSAVPLPGDEFDPFDLDFTRPGSIPTSPAGVRRMKIGFPSIKIGIPSYGSVEVEVHDIGGVEGFPAGHVIRIRPTTPRLSSLVSQYQQSTTDLDRAKRIRSVVESRVREATGIDADCDWD